jgi:hypothetical protein
MMVMVVGTLKERLVGIGLTTWDGMAPVMLWVRAITEYLTARLVSSGVI